MQKDNIDLCWIKAFSVITTLIALLMGVYGLGFVVMTVLRHYA